jgi:hypothetical protein
MDGAIPSDRLEMVRLLARSPTLGKDTALLGKQTLQTNHATRPCHLLITHWAKTSRCCLLATYGLT